VINNSGKAQKSHANPYIPDLQSTEMSRIQKKPSNACAGKFL